MATAIARHDAGWSHAWRSDLDRIDQYSGCGCEVVVTDPIDDVPTMWRDLEIDRDALWDRDPPAQRLRPRPGAGDFRRFRLTAVPPILELTVRYSKPPDRRRRSHDHHR